jgi:hypothetical protein
MDWMGIIVMPLIGWIVSVEYRLGALLGIKEAVERTDARVEKLYDHLLGQADAGSDSGRRDQK